MDSNISKENLNDESLSHNNIHFLKVWNTGSGDTISFENIVSIVREHSQFSGKVYIGCDSQLHTDKCVFATVICLHGGLKKTSRYFFIKDICPADKKNILRIRINEEVSKALKVFFLLSEKIHNLDVEIHVDVGKTERSKTRKFADSIIGWVKSSGVSCKVKPNAWASASVADKHTK
jgi:predicted RNase H-related nuclease YkuK (DUF458 family)